MSPGDNAQISVIVFRRNFGKAAALTAGFKKSRGKVVVTMDGDLQDEPEEIPSLLAELENGLDVVSGWKFPRLDPIAKTAASFVFNKVVRFATKLPLHDFNCGFKAYRREAIQDVRIYGELHRFIPALVSAKGFRVGELKVHHSPREFGHSKYGIERFFRGLFDLITVVFITKFQNRPMHLLGLMAAIMFFIGMGINAYLAVAWLFGNPIDSRPLLFLGILMIIFSVQLVSLGILADLITYHAHKPDETYQIREEWDS